MELQTSDVAELSQPIFHDALLVLVGGGRGILDEIAQDEFKQFFDRMKAGAEFLLGGGAEIFGKLHLAGCGHLGCNPHFLKAATQPGPHGVQDQAIVVVNFAQHSDEQPLSVGHVRPVLR